MLYSDKPLQNPSEDKLGYASFAKLLATSIVNMAPTDGIVLSLFGEWGSGKSTIMKFVEYYLKNDLEFSNTNRPLVREFNPWWFTNEDELIKQFFSELETVIGGLKFGDAFRDIAQKVRALGEKISDLPIPGGKWVNFVSSLLPKATIPSVAQLKEEISSALRSQNKKILIIMDDIDRLQKYEMLQLFAVIKAVADFPNIIYLLAFDPKIVDVTLNHEGLPYLEKIVQVPFELPKPSQTKLLNHLVSEMNKIIGDVPIEINRVGTFGGQGLVYDLVDLLDTPRKITRYINGLQTTFSALAPEVYAHDFVLIEALRIEVPWIYREIRESKRILTGSSIDEAATKGLREKIAKEATYIQSIIFTLFPDFRSGAAQISAPPPTRFTERRISDANSFDTYFQFALSEERASKLALQHLLDIATNGQIPKDELIVFSEENSERADDAITTLVFMLRHTKHKPDTLRNLLMALLETGDKYAHFPKEFWGVSVHTKLIGLIYEIFKQLPASDRLPTLETLIPKSEGKYTAIRVIATFMEEHESEAQHNSNPNSESILRAEEVKELTDITLDVLHSLASQPNFWDYEFFGTALHLWLEFEPTLAREWIEREISSVRKYKKFVGKFVDLPSIAQGDFHLFTADLGKYINLQRLLDISVQLRARLAELAEDARFLDNTIAAIELATSNSTSQNIDTVN